MTDHKPNTISQIRPIEEIDEFLVVEWIFSADPDKLSIGLANIHAVVPDIEANKDKSDDFAYAFDFKAIYRPMEGGRAYTREID